MSAGPYVLEKIFSPKIDGNLKLLGRSTLRMRLVEKRSLYRDSKVRKGA
jgi:hypothetical protein